ncbi:MAG TPA: hypothetical protein VMH89_13125, partial [Candidatus Acidoferrum sp.]|nr:hypothetical protein [Candidatus Acidoferrum sp.]
MAQSLKEVEALAGNTAAPAAPQPKPQPVALEIPVTVNGARTVDGSDKRVPFSENTQTVLIFPHGAVIRINTPLASGQLVFLTNEKTKKEIVCQVVKSKSSGAAGSYVELQFTEPATGFWGLQIPGASTAPLGPRPVASPTPAAPKAAAPAVPTTQKPIAPPAPVAAEPPPVAKTVVLPPPPAAPVIPATPAQTASQPETVIAATPAPPATVVAPPQAAAPQPPVVVTPPVVTEPEPIESAAPVSLTAPPAAEVVPPAAELPAAPQAPEATAHTPVSTAHQHSIPVPPIRDFSKQIEALFSVPQSPAAPASSPQQQSTPASFGPSTEDLKQQAARLQEQLNSLTFTEASAAEPVAPPDTKSALMEAPVAELTKLISEIAPGAVKPVAPAETKAAEHVESKPVVAPSKIASVSLGADDEVKMPSWLAPLAQNSEAATETSAANTSTDNAASENSEQSFDGLGGEAHRRPQTAVFGGQLLGEAAATEEASTSGSKKGLFIGIAAAIAVLAGAGWYFTQNHSGSASTPSTHSSATTESAPVSNSAAPISVPKSDSASSVPSQPSRNVAPAPAPLPAASQPKKSAQKNQEPPAPEEPAKASLGEVHLAAPVVNRSGNSPLETDGLQSVATNSVPAGTDPFSGNH